MRPIGNSPRETTVLRLEQAKSFSFGIQILEEGHTPIDISDCTVRFATKAFQREATHTTLGTVRIDLQAEDLQTPGSFPYVVTLVTSGGYASAINGCAAKQPVCQSFQVYLCVYRQYGLHIFSDTECDCTDAQKPQPFHACIL